MRLSSQLRARVEEAILDEDLAGALALLTPALAGGDAQLWADAGFLLDDLGEAEAALTHYERALALDPRCAAAWVGRGKLRATARDQAGALDDLERALTLLPGDAMSWFLKSTILEELGRREEAAECLARARILKPGLFGA